MKTKIKDWILVLIFLALIVVFLQACDNFEYKTNRSSNKQIELKFIKGNRTLKEYVDTETGVHYFYTLYGSLTPRYNIDGTLYKDGDN